MSNLSTAANGGVVGSGSVGGLNGSGSLYPGADASLVQLLPTNVGGLAGANVMIGTNGSAGSKGNVLSATVSNPNLTSWLPNDTHQNLNIPAAYLTQNQAVAAAAAAAAVAVAAGNGDMSGHLAPVHHHLGYPSDSINYCQTGVSASATVSSTSSASSGSLVDQVPPQSSIPLSASQIANSNSLSSSISTTSTTSSTTSSANDVDDPDGDDTQLNGDKQLNHNDGNNILNDGHTLITNSMNRLPVVVKTQPIVSQHFNIASFLG